MIPELFAQNNKISQILVKEFVEKYIPLVRWRKDGSGSAMDIGCGAGNTTEHILLPILPKSYRELVAVDISPEMIQYARNHHQHSRIIYDVMDIDTKKLPPVYNKRFDQVFSFVCLHFVHDQRQAMENIFEMLKPGGDILLVYTIKNGLLDTMLKVANFEHWKPYIKEPRKNVTVYHDMENVEELVYNLLREVGFENITCESSHEEFMFENMAAWLELGASVSLYNEHLPAHLKEEHRQEYCNELKNKAITEGYTNNDKGGVCFPYTLINIHARKP